MDAQNGDVGKDCEGVMLDVFFAFLNLLFSVLTLLFFHFIYSTHHLFLLPPTMSSVFLAHISRVEHIEMR